MDDDSALEKSPPGAVESDPKGRYWRFEDVLGRGAFKTVFKAFDSREGTEVAWNKVPLTTAVNEDPLKKRLFSEIHVLKRLKHKNIMTFHDYWLDDKTSTLNFITELFTHGSLKKFRAKHKHLELKVLKKWAWQILQGLVYLHGHEPPIIHRDLKCDNILINGVTGDLKIGDLGLATLFKGLEAPLSVIGTPEFMAPEFYIEKYDEKVDVYAFGMLLLELVTMDYPYCECTNPAAIYKRVSQGVFPVSIQKIRHEELRKFIELCIAYQPDARPEARKLLKHDFFNDIRGTMKPERHPSDEMDAETMARGSDFGGSVDSVKADPLSRNGSAQISFPSTSEEETEDNEQSIATSDGVKITIECSKVEDERTLNFTLKYARPGGVPKNIQFPFDIKDDTAEQIVAEMRAEGSTDLDIMITEEEANTIGQLIAMEVDRWNGGGMKAFLTVMRPCDNDVTSCHLPSVGSFEAREVLESELDDICQSVATDLTEDHVFRTLEKSRALMNFVQADNSRRSVDYAGAAISRRSVDFTAVEYPRRSLKQKLGIINDEHESGETLSETNVLFSGKDENPGPFSEGPLDLSDDEEIASPGAIDIPPKRRMSSSSVEPAHSISSTLSDSHLHTPLRGSNSAISRSFQRRLSGRMSAVDGSSLSTRPSILRSMSMTVEGSSHAAESPLKVCSPQVPVELSLVVVEPKSDSESPVVSGLEAGLEHDMGQDARQGTNTSLISMVTMKQTPSKKGLEVSMPTVPELSTPNTSQTVSPKPPKGESSALRSLADEWQWTLINGPLLAEAESTANLSQTQSVGVSPRSSFRRVDSSGSTVDHGIKSPPLSQEHDSCGRSDMNAPLMLSLKTAEGAGMTSRPSSVGIAQSVEDIRELESEGQEQAAGLHALIPHHHHLQQQYQRQEILNRGLATTLQSTKHSRRMTADSMDFQEDFLSPPSPQHCRPSYDVEGPWDSESIRAFRRDEGAAVVAGPSFPMRRAMAWPQGQGSDSTKQRVNRLFNSCAELGELLPGRTGMQPQGLYSNATSFDTSIHPSPSDAALAHLADPHPFLSLAHPVQRRGSHPPEPKAGLGLIKTSSDVVNQWADFEEDPVAVSSQKQQRSHSKELRRRKAAENIDKMQQQQLAGLCHGAAVGVASSSKPMGGKGHQHRPSMNGSVHL